MEMADGRLDTAGEQATEAVGWSRIAVWCGGAWRLLRRAPLRLILLALAPIVVEGLLQLMPIFGVVLSKLLVPVIMAWALIMIDRKARADRFAPADAGRRLRARWKQLIVLALVSATVFAFQVVVALWIGGGSQALAFVLGDMAGVLRYSRMELAGILASGQVLVAFLFFVAPRVLLDGLGVGSAIVENARQLLRCWRPILLFTAAMSAMIAGFLWMPLLLLVLLPASTYIAYAAYRDVFDHPAAA